MTRPQWQEELWERNHMMDNTRTQPCQPTRLEARRAGLGTQIGPFRCIMRVHLRIGTRMFSKRARIVTGLSGRRRWRITRELVMPNDH